MALCRPPPSRSRRLLLTLAGWVNLHQQQVIEFLVEENRVLREQLGERPLRLTDDRRRRLAVEGKVLGRRALERVVTIVTPDTIMRWHRKLIAAMRTYASLRMGRLGLLKEIRELIVRFAKENPSWGYCRIQGALKNLGHCVAASTIAKTLKEHGIKPARERPSSWRVFPKTHWEEVVGADSFTTEVWTARGLKTCYVLFMLELPSRRVSVVGITRHPDDLLMGRAAEESLSWLAGKRFLICDRDTTFSKRFRIVLETAGTALLRTPFQAPSANAHAERFVRSIKEECRDRLIPFGEGHLRRAIEQYLVHHPRERNHQGIGNELIEGSVSARDGRVECDERLGGLLEYHRRAA